MENVESTIKAPRLQFKQAQHYVFFYEDTHVLLLIWERDYTKNLYIILDQNEDGSYVVDYPGTLFTERLMDLVDALFFIQVQEQEETNRYALGAYYQEGDTWFGAYYPRDNADAADIHEVIFFKVAEAGAGYALQELEPADHAVATSAFMRRYQDVLQISM